MSGWRVIVVTGRGKLDLRYNSISIRRDNGTDFIHIGEVNTLILETTTISITAALMCELIKQKVKVIFCDEKSNPHFELLPFYGSHDCSAKIKEQIAWTDFLKESLWTVIVTEKIENQMKLLKKLNKEEYRLLEQYLSELEWNDSSNREGFAAKVYFNALYGMDFSRNKECFINAALDYGYSIILSAFNREIVASGYFTQLGLCHRNPFNKFNLSSDFMEPFRILVDEEVYNLEGTEFTKDHKNKLINILNKTVIIDDKNQTVANAIKIYCRSLFSALAENDLEYVKMYRYEL